MKKILIASASAIAVLGLAACGDTDEMTTQGVEPAEETAPANPATNEPAMEEPATEEPAEQ